MNWIKKLVVGETVIIDMQYGRYELLKKVKRITKTLIITEDEQRFTISSGYTPGGGYNKNSISQWSQEKEDAIKIKIAKINYHRKFKNFDWTSLSIKDLRAINKLLKGE